MADDYLIRLIKKRLIDPNYQVTVEEVAKATVSLETRIEIANLYLNQLLAEKKSLDHFIMEMKKNDKLSKDFPEYLGKE